VEIKKIELDVFGMSCTNCSLSVKRILEKQGLKDVEVDFPNSKATFIFDKDKNIDKIISEIKNIGFDAKLADEDQESTEPPKSIFSIENKFIFSLIFTLPLLLHMFLPFHFLHNNYFQMIISIPVIIIGIFHFGKSAFYSLKSGVANMDVLIIIGSLSAFIYSFTGTILDLGNNYVFYETSATIITVVLLGNLIEHRAVSKTTTAIKELIKLQNPDAKLIKINPRTNEEEIIIVKAKEIKKGDKLLINTGDNIPVDGEIFWGEASIDESMLTGESIPVYKKISDKVFGGTIISNGNLKIQAFAVGKETVLSQIIKIVKEAQAKKPEMQKLSDKVSKIFVPAVVLISVLTFIVSFFAADISFNSALLNSIAVLVIACPCAMGLAVPTAVVVGVGKAAKNGILVKGADTLEKMTKIKSIVFDKTGTLTTGFFKIKKINTYSQPYDKVTSIIYSLEKYSSHVIAKSLVNELNNSKEILFDKIEEIKGIGLIAEDNVGIKYKIGSYEIAKNLTPDDSHNLYLIENDSLIATIDLADELKPQTKELISTLKKMGLRTILLSGDNQKSCEEIGRNAGIDYIYFKKSPEEKLIIIEQLSNQNHTAMVGDGINDAPALARATVGISLSDATQVAIQSAQVILLNGNLEHLIYAFKISQKTIKTIKQNLFWAFFYNIIAIPFAMFGFLNPMIAAISMALSDVIVIGNSLRFKYKK